ncbi:hypothetical protein TFLX_03026 [Thermoflexales bacterium]|nr:hypothetical protein TFLX_03026 [Thermoflexales bacterium]
MRDDFDALWNQLAYEVMSGMKEWRLQHPKATLREIEAALDERLGRMRARMLEDVALASTAAAVSQMSEAERPTCPACGAVLTARGHTTREVTTHFDQTLRLKRSYTVCPRCGAGLFPPG